MRPARLLALLATTFVMAAFARPALASCDTPRTPAPTRPLAPRFAPTRLAPTSQPRFVPASLPIAFSQPTIVGLWLTSVTVDGQPFGQGYEAFTSDGLETLYDTAAPASGNVCLGVWTATGGRTPTVKLKHPAWNFDENGNVVGTTLIRAEITLGAGGNAFRGPITFDIYDADGTLLQHVDGELTGRRVTVD